MYFKVLVLAATAALISACGQGSAGGGAGGTGATPAQAKTLLAELPAPFSQADLTNGEAHFSLCRSCHTIVSGGANMTGPNLYGVFGRKAGTHPDFNYSDALKSKGLVWDVATLNQWLEGPQTFVPGTKMSFVGIKDQTDRRDVIGYLKLASSATPP